MEITVCLLSVKKHFHFLRTVHFLKTDCFHIPKVFNQMFVPLKPSINGRTFTILEEPCRLCIYVVHSCSIFHHQPFGYYSVSLAIRLIYHGGTAGMPLALVEIS